jgi:hypothetical protein
MVNWGALIEAPIGVMLIYVAVVMIEPLQIPLFGLLGNANAFPHGATTRVLVQLIPLVLGIMLLYSSYKSFREPDTPRYVIQG